MKKRKLMGGFNRFRLILTLIIAVVLPAAALIVLNFYQLRSFQRDKVLEATIHRDFQEVLAITEKSIDKKALSMVDDINSQLPSPELSNDEKEKALDELLTKNPTLAHAFIWEEHGMVLRSQPGQLSDQYVRKEQEYLAEMLPGWFDLEGK